MVGPEDDIQLTLATPRAYSAAEAARVQPERPDSPAHDAFTRLLHHLEPDPDALWAEAAPPSSGPPGYWSSTTPGLPQDWWSRS